MKRLFPTVPIGLKLVMLKAQIQRLECKDDGLVQQERIRFVDEEKAIHEDFQAM